MMPSDTRGGGPVVPVGPGRLLEADPVLLGAPGRRNAGQGQVVDESEPRHCIPRRADHSTTLMACSGQACSANLAAAS